MVKKKKVARNYWFKRKWTNVESGWGFVPINWKGWVALILLVGVNVFASQYFDVMNSPFEEVSKFLVVFLFSLVVFILIAKKKTGALPVSSKQLAVSSGRKGRGR